MAGHDRVEHAVRQQELRRLKIVGQLLVGGLLDYAAAGEADHRAGLGEIQIAETRERRRDAARGRIAQHRDVGDARVAQPRDCAETFAICISESAPSCIRAPPEAAENDHRHPPLERVIHQSASFSPTTTPMLPPMKLKSINASAVVTLDLREADHDCVVATG